MTATDEWLRPVLARGNQTLQAETDFLPRQLSRKRCKIGEITSLKIPYSGEHTMKQFSILGVVCLFVISATTLTHADEPQAKKKKPAPPRRPNPAMAKVEDVPGLPRVLLIGDSISIGYTVPVRELLKGKANVHRPPANCGPTTAGVANIDKWLGDGNWDVIHFNWGLHDLKYMGPQGQNLADPNAADSKQQVPPAEYEANLKKLVARLKQTGAKLIWRSTTPVPEGAKGRVVGDAARYNAIAFKIMEENRIPVDDHYTLVIEKIQNLQRPKDVHFVAKGSEALAASAVAAIEKALAD